MPKIRVLEDSRRAQSGVAASLKWHVLSRWLGSRRPPIGVKSSQSASSQVSRRQVKTPNPPIYKYERKSVSKMHLAQVLIALPLQVCCAAAGLPVCRVAPCSWREAACSSP